MKADPDRDDIHAIEALVDRQFASMSWGPKAPANWNAFAADFLPDASLYASARPAKRQSVGAFIERMQSIAGTKLLSFHETVLGTEIRVFGHIAVAVAACKMLENGTDMKRGVEMLLLVKDEGVWKIVAQAWDTEGPLKQIPTNLLGRTKPG